MVTPMPLTARPARRLLLSGLLLSGRLILGLSIVALFAAGCSSESSATAVAPPTSQATTSTTATTTAEPTPSEYVEFGDENIFFVTGPLHFPLEWIDDETLDAGFSQHVAVWPFQEVHAGPRFTGGLPGTWMGAKDLDHPFYSTIEGGTGTGEGNRFPSQGTKFTIGAVSADFTHWANGPGTGGGLEGEVYWDEWRWDVPQGKYGIAQLSQHVLYPPDGLNMAADSNGGLLGYGYHPLPIIDARETSGPFGSVDTGNQSWTAFLSTANFQGPVAFIIPDFYSYPIVNVEEVAAELDESPFLDTVGSDQNQLHEVELWEIPTVHARDANGTSFVRTTRTQFPANGGDENSSVILHNISAYRRTALWDATVEWFDGGEAPSGALDPNGTFVKSFEGRDLVNEYLGWFIIPADGEEGEFPEYPIDWTSLVEVDISDPATFRYRWNLDLVENVHGNFVVPDYFRLDEAPESEAGKVWTPILEADVPAETGLTDYVFPELSQPQNQTGPYETPTEADSPWQSPGPASAEIEVSLGDGTVVTYAWYRFVDQPAMAFRDFTDAELDAIQARVEMIHREWAPDRPYLAPPTVGELVSLDEGVLVTPPPGMEVGYVPIVTRQALAGE